MKKALLLLACSLLAPSNGQAECFCDPLKKISQARSVVVAKIAAASSQADVNQCREAINAETNVRNLKPCPLFFEAEVESLLAGAKTPVKLRVNYSSLLREDDDVYQASSTPVALLLADSNPDGTSALLSYECHCSIVYLDSKEKFEEIRAATKQ